MKNEDFLKLTEQQLADEIERHNRLYWNNNTPEISDEDYDRLVSRLQELNPDHPLLDHIGKPEVASLGKVRLDDPMLSLDKTYYFKDAPKGKKSLMKWLEENSRSDEEKYIVQPKYDGISANYSDGILATRGQGTEDENISDKIPLIELEAPGYTGPLDRPARGEILIRDDDFRNAYCRIVKTGGGTYKNPRNAVGGILGLKDISDIKRQGAKLTMVDYNLHSRTIMYRDFEHEWQKIVDEIESLPYPMDGIVIKLADDSYSKTLGFTAHHPRGQIAFKFSGVRRKTTLLDVIWGFGKKCLTPVGRVEPVEIGGVSISNVTLHNAALVEEKGWQIGDTVTIERAGDVIPHIVGSEPGKERKPFLITRCPGCGAPLLRESKELRCVNPDCFETNLQKILSSVRNIGIEELGEPNIRKIMSVLGARKLKDILSLSIDDILKLEGFKMKSATNLYNSIQKARNTTDYQLLASLNIEGIGQTIAEKLLRDYSLNELRSMSLERLSVIPEIGPETSLKLYNSLKELSGEINELAEAVNLISTKKDDQPKPLVCLDIDAAKSPFPVKHYEELARLHNFNRIKKDVKINDRPYLPEALKTYVTTKQPDSASEILSACREAGIEIMSPENWEASLPLISTHYEKAKTICFTGKMPETRSYYENLARKSGFVPVDTVSTELALLVTDDINSGSSKCIKARKNGIAIQSLAEWLESIGQKTLKGETPDGFIPGLY